MILERHNILRKTPATSGKRGKEDRPLFPPFHKCQKTIFSQFLNIYPETPTNMADEKENIPIGRKEDRRERPTPFLSRYTFVGRRRASRRGEERYNYYVDRPGSKVWGVIAIIFILSISDSLFTLHFLKKGFQEVNPLMSIAILIGKPVFILSKYIFTIIGILILGMHKNFIFIRELITLMIIFYVLLNAYHIWLFIH